MARSSDRFAALMRPHRPHKEVEELVALAVVARVGRSHFTTRLPSDCLFFFRIQSLSFSFGLAASSFESNA